jgi:hypothetical protein
MKKQELRNFIKEVVKHVLRENWEPYDAETDQFGAAPRDRTEPSNGNVGIPEYPQSIVKQHDMDGEPRWFVYSSSEPTALILGYGKSQEDAIHNAKTTAGFIKHGGVGHTGELKEERIDWEAFKKEKYGEEGIDWTRVDMGNGMQAMAKIQKPQDKLKTKTSMTGFDGDPTQSYGRSSEPQTFSEVDEDYDEQEEIELITQIKELSSVWMKTVSPEKYVMYLEGIYRVSEKLLKMHGAK